jgi:hypothetical protein
MIPPRGVPTRCEVCQSRVVKRHCAATGLCRWVICQDCKAVTGTVGTWADGKFVGWKRAAFTIRRRTLG